LVWFGVVLFSLGPVLVAGSGLSGPAFSFWRLWMGVGILGIATLVHRHLTGSRFTRVGVGWAVASGVAFAAHQVAFMSAVRQASVVDVTLMNTVAPIVVGVLAVRLFGERPGVRFRAWSALAMSGAVAVVVAGSTGPSGDPWGMALAAVNVVFFAFYFVGTKLGRPHLDTTPFLWVVIVTAAASVSLFVGATGEAVVPIAGSDLLRCLAVAVLPGAVGHFSVTWSLRWVPANVPPVIMLAIPALSGVLAWIVLGQAVSWGQLAAGAVTLGGVLGAVRSPTASVVHADESLLTAEET
jgi:drug/metabolite transporter (DMT)-like permease